MISLVATRRRLTNQLGQFGYQIWQCNFCRKKILTDALFLAHLRYDHGLSDRDFSRFLSGATEAQKTEVANYTLKAREGTSRAS